MAEERIGVGVAERKDGYKVVTGSNLGHCRVCRCDLAVFGIEVRCMVCGLPHPEHEESKRLKAIMEEKKKVPPRPTVGMMAPAGAEFFPMGLPPKAKAKEKIDDQTVLDVPVVEAEKLPAMMRPPQAQPAAPEQGAAKQQQGKKK